MPTYAKQFIRIASFNSLNIIKQIAVLISLVQIRNVYHVFLADLGF
jgi:hypothetical protein